MKITVYWLTSEDSKGTFTRLFESKAKRDAAFTTWLREHIDKEDAGGTAGLVTDDEDHLLARLTAGEHPASVYGDYLELKTGNYAIDGQAEVTIPNRKPNTEALAILHNVVTRWPQFDDGREVNGTELVDWFSHFRTKAKLLVDGLALPAQELTADRILPAEVSAAFLEMLAAADFIIQGWGSGKLSDAINNLHTAANEARPFIPLLTPDSQPPAAPDASLQPFTLVIHCGCRGCDGRQIHHVNATDAKTAATTFHEPDTEDDEKVAPDYLTLVAVLPGHHTESDWEP